MYALMSDPVEDIMNLDRLVHEPARLAILLTLGACKSADFMFLQAATGLSKGNLSLHLGKLEAGGMIAIERTYAGKRPRMIVRLTKDGRTAIRTHRRSLEEMWKAARHV